MKKTKISFSRLIKPSRTYWRSLNPFPLTWTLRFADCMFLFYLFPKLLGIQITCPRYLKVCPDLPKDKWNTFRTIGDLPETFSSKDNQLLSSKLSCQDLKKLTFFKDEFPDGHGNPFFWLFPKPLGIQNIRSSYLKVCL